MGLEECVGRRGGVGGVFRKGVGLEECLGRRGGVGGVFRKEGWGWRSV